MSKYAELIEFLNEKFTAIDGRFNAIDEKFVIIDNKFIAMDERFNSLELNMADKVDKKDFNTLMSSVDAIAKKMDTYHKQLSAHKHKVNRIEDWMTQAAPKIN